MLGEKGRAMWSTEEKEKKSEEFAKFGQGTFSGGKEN